MKIAIIIEGATEVAFKPILYQFLHGRLAGRMPRLDTVPCDGRIPKEGKLRRLVERLLTAGTAPADAVIALTDVYTGTSDFSDAADARQKMRLWAANNPRFYPHAAQHDFEAWLLPYWPRIQELAGHNRGAPPGAPESVDHNNPPSRRIADLFIAGSRGRRYVKPRDARRILEGQDLTVSANACPQLKAFLNTILGLCGGPSL